MLACAALLGAGGALSAAMHRAPTTLASSKPATNRAEQLRALLEDALAPANRQPLPRVATVELLTSGGQQVIRVAWHVNENRTHPMIALGARHDVVTILHTLRAAGARCDEVQLSGTFTISGLYGDVIEREVVSACYAWSAVESLPSDCYPESDIYARATSARVHREFDNR